MTDLHCDNCSCEDEFKVVCPRCSEKFALHQANAVTVFGMSFGELADRLKLPENHQPGGLFLSITPDDEATWEIPCEHNGDAALPPFDCQVCDDSGIITQRLVGMVPIAQAVNVDSTPPRALLRLSWMSAAFETRQQVIDLLISIHRGGDIPEKYYFTPNRPWGLLQERVK